MSHLLETYRSNAVAARLEAKHTTLPNVRQRAIEAAEVWERLADRLAKTEFDRQERDQLSDSRIAR
jgi:hypothetical protein